MKVLLQPDGNAVVGIISDGMGGRRIWCMGLIWGIVKYREDQYQARDAE